MGQIYDKDYSMHAFVPANAGRNVETVFKFKCSIGEFDAFGNKNPEHQKLIDELLEIHEQHAGPVGRLAALCIVLIDELNNKQDERDPETDY